MLVIKCKSTTPRSVYDRLVADLTAQAKNGVVVLEKGLELEAAAPADEEIKVVQKIPKAKGVVVPREEWRAAMDYITALHDCATCKYEMDGSACLESYAECSTCTIMAQCPCANCHDGSGWEWRYGHGKD